MAIQNNAHYSLVVCETRLTISVSTALFIDVAETPRKITAFVIEREIHEFLHKFLEESRGSRTRQNGREYQQNSLQNRQIGDQLGRQL
ncbi:hypothetical protein TNCV_2206231 [Trichonephila clavipes]|uniref:Uncharacterized protein n=1 Tax=Trichonephila clavipes TaxID=2585209 RepID=A0A8X6S0F9_TRICX|nr:hypothetical protein TNCV_2206231 [Trichonephila clavipes]